MLVLSRKVGDKIQIGEEITIVFTRIAGNRVTVGIEAPDDVHILRPEIPPGERTRPRPSLRRKLVATVTPSHREMPFTD